MAAKYIAGKKIILETATTKYIAGKKIIFETTSVAAGGTRIMNPLYGPNPLRGPM